MNGTMDYNWIGVAFIDETLPDVVHKMVESKMEDLRSSVQEEFGRWLDSNDLEWEMGVILKKGTVKQ